MEIRKLKMRDVFEVAAILGDSTDNIKSLMNDLENESATSVGISLFGIVAQTLGETRTQEWIASLVDMEREEFLEEDAQVAIEIIEELKDREDVQNFFDSLRKTLKMG